MAVHGKLSGEVLLLQESSQAFDHLLVERARLEGGLLLVAPHSCLVAGEILQALDDDFDHLFVLLCGFLL